jgi:S-adenosylmethionine hydrolase
MAMTNFISFTTDFGVTDTSVGQCKGVIASIAPKATVIDITHAVPHYDVATGSWLLRHAVPHFPACVHVAVVDPGVGTTRRGIAVECARGDILVGPDNGLLLAAAAALGGIKSAVELANPQFRHHPVSNTFHARDIFCPAAAHLVHGVGLHNLGPPLAAAALVQLPAMPPEIRDGAIAASVALINEFGSLALTAPGSYLAEIGNPSAVAVTLGGDRFAARVVRTFGDASTGERVLFVDSYGQLCLAINQGDLALALGLARTARPALSIQPLPGDTAEDTGDTI